MNDKSEEQRIALIKALNQGCYPPAGPKLWDVWKKVNPNDDSVEYFYWSGDHWVSYAEAIEQLKEYKRSNHT